VALVGEGERGRRDGRGAYMSKERREWEWGDKSPALSSQDLGSTGVSE